MRSIGDPETNTRGRSKAEGVQGGGGAVGKPPADPKSAGVFGNISDALHAAAAQLTAAPKAFSDAKKQDAGFGAAFDAAAHSFIGIGFLAAGQTAKAFGELKSVATGVAGYAMSDKGAGPLGNTLGTQGEGAGPRLPALRPDGLPGRPMPLPNIAGKKTTTAAPARYSLVAALLRPWMAT